MGPCGIKPSGQDLRRPGNIKALLEIVFPLAALPGDGHCPGRFAKSKRHKNQLSTSIFSILSTYHDNLMSFLAKIMTQGLVPAVTISIREGRPNQ